MRNLLGVLLLIAFGAGCGPSYPSATSPSPSASPSSPPSLVSLASLAIEDPHVTVGPSALPGMVAVQLWFLLRETSGKSSATIDRMLVGDGHGGGDWYDSFCLEGLRVPAGGVLDTFYTEEGHEWLGYCVPHGGVIGADVEPYPIVVTVFFSDDQGGGGSVTATAVWK